MHHTPETTSIFLHDPTIWMVLSFVAFMVLVYVYGRKHIIGMIDAKIEKIRSDIASAETLKNEANALLLKYKSDVQNASTEAEAIIAKAKKQADDIRAQATIELNETMARREAMLTARIEQMERAAVDDIRRYAAELAVNATREIIVQKLSPSSATAQMDDSIRHIGEKLN